MPWKMLTDLIQVTSFSLFSRVLELLFCVKRNYTGSIRYNDVFVTFFA